MIRNIWGVMLVATLLGVGFGCAHSHDKMDGQQNDPQQFPEQGGEEEAGRDHGTGDPRFYEDTD